MKCPKCGTEQLEPFCDKCGYQFTSATPISLKNYSSQNSPEPEFQQPRVKRFQNTFSLLALIFLILCWPFLISYWFDFSFYLIGFYVIVILLIIALTLICISGKLNERFTQIVLILLFITLSVLYLQFRSEIENPAKYP